MYGRLKYSILSRLKPSILGILLCIVGEGLNVSFRLYFNTLAQYMFYFHFFYILPYHIHAHLRYNFL